MTAHIILNRVSVNGVDTYARASSLRQWFVGKQSLSAARIPILRDVTLHIKAGERVALVGMNGCGKSSLMKVIAGIYPVHAGECDVRGEVVPMIEMGAGYVGELPGRANIKLSFAYRGLLHHYSKKVADDIIAFSELGDKIDLPVKTYSSGMLSRLMFSVALFQEPDILLLDEIMATGDEGFVNKSRHELHARIDRAAITVMVSHDADSLKAVCNRFVLVHQGRIIGDGSADDVFKQYHALLEGRRADEEYSQRLL